MKQTHILLTATVLLLFSCQSKPKGETGSEKPNIIYIYTDQQSASMMSCAGNEWLKTPAMDYIAENSIRFTRAYTPNPVCSPARVSLMTGRFPGYFYDVDGNQDPYETTHFTNDPAYTVKLKTLRDAYDHEWFL